MELDLVSDISLIPVRPVTDMDLPLEESASAPLPLYVSGPENLLLKALYRSLLIENNLCQSGFNPAILFGPSGVGKSHLALGLADAWKSQQLQLQRTAKQARSDQQQSRKDNRRQSDRHRSDGSRQPLVRTSIISSRDWALGYAAAHKQDELRTWRDEQREVDLFVIEDLAQLHRRQSAQRELATLLDDLNALEVPCLVTSRANPLAMSELLPDLASRLIRGLTIPVQHPSDKAREQIIYQLAKQRDFELAEDATSFLANHGSTFVALRSTLMSCFLAQPEKRHFAISDVRRALNDNPASKQLPLKIISTAVARYFGVTSKQIVGPSRRQAVTRARGIAIYLCRELTSSSLKDIGRHFGNRDHTTIIHACRITEQRSHTESDVQTAIDDLKSLLKNRN